MRDSIRYQVGVRGDSVFLLSKTSVSILKALSKGSRFSYEELHEATDIPMNSLYVFCERLQKASLLNRRRRVSRGRGKVEAKAVRLRTELSLRGAPLTFPKVKVIR